MRVNLPNQVTLARLGLTVVFVALLSCFDAGRLAEQRWLLHACFWLFLVAALLDILDGLLARLLRSVTSFGRIVDPVVDKVLVCSAFVLFASDPFWDAERGRNITGVAPWMVIVILAREFFVSAVRAHVESTGREFGASWAGKLKMFIQCFAVSAVLAGLVWNLDPVGWLPTVSVWAAVVVTALSAASYTHRARAFLLSSAALGGAATALGGAAQRPAATPDSAGASLDPAGESGDNGDRSGRAPNRGGHAPENADVPADGPGACV